ncbi:TRAP transporter substrate-binding protein [Falsiroseomonas tokyonensis]|uniref:TRAP transporter substrate-binding protein n=1 Tax=Falsiroseomonas tokyonensis TaxID=430521 RepID=A0ABV7BNM9_9PROT|nr:TRAP transporter substrate-binding protein DctP [Falsiroseomonas tokyonensis]MBU8536811.1 TRAP transporter substrate-binding protein DctP [Falsiroseomonas tokyonensis]
MRKWMLGAMAALLGLAGTARAQNVEWRFHNSYAPTRIESQHVRELAADLRTRTNGRFTLNVFEGNAMNLRDADMLRTMQGSTPEMSFIWPPFLGRDDAAMSSILVFGLIRNAAELNRVMPALQESLSQGIRRWNIEPVGFMQLGLLDAALFCRSPVRTLDELRRVKLRVGSREQVETFRALGVAAQIVPQQELYAAMQTGVVDCALYPPRIVHTISLQEVAKHATSTGFAFPPTPYIILANQARFRALSAENRSALQAAVGAMEQRSARFEQDAADDEAARERLRGQGVTFHPTFSEAEQQAIRTAAMSTWDTLMREAGGQGPAWRTRIQSALGAN